MKVDEAISLIQKYKNLWARPISWRGSGIAIGMSGPRLVVVPTTTGGRTWHVQAKDLVDNWETIHFELVLAEARPLW